MVIVSTIANAATLHKGGNSKVDAKAPLAKDAERGDPATSRRKGQEKSRCENAAGERGQVG